MTHLHSDPLSHLADHLELHFEQVTQEMARAVMAQLNGTAGGPQEGESQHLSQRESSARLRAALRTLRAPGPDGLAAGQPGAPLADRALERTRESGLTEAERTVLVRWVERYLQRVGPAMVDTVAREEAATPTVAMGRRLARLRLEPVLASAAMHAREICAAEAAVVLVVSPTGALGLRALHAPGLPPQDDLFASLDWEPARRRARESHAFRDSSFNPDLPPLLHEHWSWVGAVPLRMPGPPPELAGLLVVLAEGEGDGRLEALEEIGSTTEMALGAAEVVVAAVEGAVEAERASLAREIHDGVAADLAVIVSQIKVQQETGRAEGDGQALGMVREMTEEALQEARGILSTLRGRRGTPPKDRRRLREDLEAIAAAAGLALDFRLEGDEARLRAEETEMVQQVAREAFTNVRRHSGTFVVRITGNLTVRPFLIEIADEGAGFDPDSVPGPGEPEHFGLTGMRERVALVGASLDVVSAPGRGTTVRVRGPQEMRRSGA